MREWNESAGFICGHMDVAQAQTTVAVHGMIKQTRPPSSEMDSSRIKRVHDRQQKIELMFNCAWD